MNPLGSCDGAGLWERPTRAPVPPTGLVLEHHLPGGEGEEQGLESLPSPREHSAPRRRVRPRGLGQAEGPGQCPQDAGAKGRSGKQSWCFRPGRSISPTVYGQRGPTRLPPGGHDEGGCLSKWHLSTQFAVWSVSWHQLQLPVKGKEVKLKHRFDL